MRTHGPVRIHIHILWPQATCTCDEYGRMIEAGMLRVPITIQIGARFPTLTLDADSALLGPFGAQEGTPSLRFQYIFYIPRFTVDDESELVVDI